MTSYTLQNPEHLCDHVRKVEAKLKGCKDCAKCDGKMFGRYICKIDKAPRIDGYCYYREGKV